MEEGRSGEETQYQQGSEDGSSRCSGNQMFSVQFMQKVVIDFTASWCGPCRFIAPVFVELAKKYRDAVFLKVDVDELKEVATEYKIEAMPTFLFIKNGDKVDTVVGARKDELHAKVEKHHAAATASA